jgi:hypothetical protein
VPQTSIEELQSYFEENVIRGSGAFIELSDGYANYAGSMKRKLLRELTGYMVSQN